jgi:probable rRNA maturation factor
MKMFISVNDTRIKKKTSKDLPAKLSGILVLEDVFLKFLAKNPHFKSVNEVSMNLTLCGKIKIKNLNNKFRAKNKITDVLSFGVHENLRPDKKPFFKNSPFLDLGDIFICKEIAVKQSKMFEISYEQEVLHLATHGFLHLLGFDHEISLKEEKIMESNEDALIKAIYKKLGKK